MYQPLFFGFADTADKYMLLYPIFTLATDATVTDNFAANEPRFYRVSSKDIEKLTITVLAKGQRVYFAQSNQAYLPTKNAEYCEG